MSWVTVRSLAKYSDKNELIRVAYELLRYNTILKPSSDEFTATFLRVSAIFARHSRNYLQIATSWGDSICLGH